MTGVNRQTFELMVDVVKASEKKKKKPGRRPKLIVEDQVLMVIQYWREYRTYYHIGLDWELSESATCRTVLKIENILIKSRKFSLPGKKKLLEMSSQLDLVVMDVTQYCSDKRFTREVRTRGGGDGGTRRNSRMTYHFNLSPCPLVPLSPCPVITKNLLTETYWDVTESPIERPKKGQKKFFSGKQREHTLKTQVVINQKSSQIICLGHGQGRIHDFRLFKTSRVRFGELLKVIADKGYQGIKKIHQLSETPVKKAKGKKLTKAQKKYNRDLNRLRITVEHVNRRLKIFKILDYRYRNRHRRFGLRSNLIAGIYNQELAL